MHVIFSRLYLYLQLWFIPGDPVEYLLKEEKKLPYKKGNYTRKEFMILGDLVGTFNVVMRYLVLGFDNNKFELRRLVAVCLAIQNKDILIAMGQIITENKYGNIMSDHESEVILKVLEKVI